MKRTLKLRPILEGTLLQKTSLIFFYVQTSLDLARSSEVSSLKKRLNEIYSKHTGKSVDEVKSALERDNFMTADVAKSFGLIDEVVEKRS